jgi:hypothetical protein
VVGQSGQVKKIPAAQVVKRDVSTQSMMPANLINTPQEMRDMIAYLSVPLEQKK